MVNVGDKAPDFTAFDQNSNEIKLSSFLGKKVVLYFYPKDDTPGCTKEACSFRDNFDELKKFDIVVLGVSADTTESHKKFEKKYSLQFSLLSDKNKEIIKLYEVFDKKKTFSLENILGLVRTTFLIDEEGTIIYIFNKVKTDIHAQEVLEKFNSLKK